MSHQSAATPSGRKRHSRPAVLTPLVDFARSLDGYLAPLLIFSFVTNLLMLVAPLYMLQIYDRVLTSGSADTLIWLTIIAGFLSFFP